MIVNKRIKNGIKKYHKPNVRIKFCLGTIALVSICVMLLIISTFTQIKFNFDMTQTELLSYLKFEYIPQIPAVLFIAALLGEFWGLAAVLIYIIMGLTPFFPVFALGGGLSYVFQYNFGYIFAYLFAVFFAAKQIKNNNSIPDILLGVLYGILIIHIIGILYMFIIALLRHDSVDFIFNWIYYQSLSKILYDVVFGFIAVLIAIIVRKLLWILI